MMDISLTGVKDKFICASKVSTWDFFLQIVLQKYNIIISAFIRFYDLQQDCVGLVERKRNKSSEELAYKCFLHSHKNQV